MTLLVDISKGLDQPPWWLTSVFTALLGAVVGFFSGLIGQSVVIDLVGQRNMRRVLYLDLAQMFWAVDRFTGADAIEVDAAAGSNRLQWQQDQLRKFLFFLGDEYCQKNPAVYVQLPERFASQTLYRCFHCLLDDPADALNLNSHRVRVFFAAYTCDGVLKGKYFRRYLGRKKALALLRIVERYRRAQ